MAPTIVSEIVNSLSEVLSSLFTIVTAPEMSTSSPIVAYKSTLSCKDIIYVAPLSSDSRVQVYVELLLLVQRGVALTGVISVGNDI